MSTLETIEGKLDEVLERLTALERNTVATTTTEPGVLAAYDLPPIPKEQVKVDEQSVNRDGSVWVWSTGFSPVSPTPGGNPRVPVQMYYGYISPKKCPRLWELARRVLGEQSFAEWETDWKAHKYGVYVSNPADTAPEVSIEDLAKVVNFMMFFFRVHRVRDFPQ